MKITKTTLKKIEDLCGKLGYKLRYEQGHFQAGYCRLEDKKILIINKFFDVEGRYQCILDLLPSLPMPDETLDTEIQKEYDKFINLTSHSDVTEFA